MTINKREEVIEFYDKWDTTPVLMNISYVDDEYTAVEWRTRRQIENIGRDMYTYSAWIDDLSELDFGL